MFDSGLIGEGVLHAVAAAHANLLQPDATLVPIGLMPYPVLVMSCEASLCLDIEG